MRLIIDGETINEPISGVAAALGLAQERADQLGRLIIEVKADGMPADALLDDIPEDSGGVTELGITTADRRSFLAETLHEARDVLDRVQTDQQSAANQIDQGQIQESLTALRGVLEGWQAVRTVVDQSAALLGVDLASVNAGDTRGDEAVAGLARELVELRDAVSAEDWSALSDLLGYDLEQRAGVWRSLIDGLIAAANAGGDQHA